MRTPDLDRERSEQSRSLAEFMSLYNATLPLAFPRASAALLKEFKNTHASLFKPGGVWSLDIHRKKVMDWLRPRSAELDR